MTAQIILASASPRRRELLDQIKLRYRVVPVDLDETPWANETPSAYVQRLAAEKSEACVQLVGDSLPVLAADTAVVLDELIMGKPKNKDDAFSMLRQLSGRTHRVYTAVSLRGASHLQALSITKVSFRQLTENEIIRYWDSGEPVDKAGSYAIQGMGSIFVQSISGSFSGVVGLPLFETSKLLSRLGIQ